MTAAGADGGQVFKIKSHSTLVVGLRRLDVGAEFRGKQMTWAPLIVIEGPTEPPTLNHILRPTVKYFCDHNPGVLTLILFRGSHFQAYLAHQPKGGLKSVMPVYVRALSSVHVAALHDARLAAPLEVLQCDMLNCVNAVVYM